MKLLKGHPLLVVVVVGVVAYALFGDKLPHLDTEKLLDDVSTKLGKLTYLLVAVLAFLETGAFVGLVFPGETAVHHRRRGRRAGRDLDRADDRDRLVLRMAGRHGELLHRAQLGREFILEHGPRVRITEARFAQVEGYFHNHGGKTILVGRFIGLVRALAPFIAGSSGMRYRAFVPYSMLGTGLWAAAFSLLGYFLSSSIGKAASIRRQRARSCSAVTVAVLVVSSSSLRTLRDPSRRSNAGARASRATGSGRPVVAFGRRIEPQARFIWHRLTPGGLGLELTSLLAVLAVAELRLLRLRDRRHGAPGPTGATTRRSTSVGDISDGLDDDLLRA